LQRYSAAEEEHRNADAEAAALDADVVGLCRLESS
jgi:hypothetical protein